MYIEPGPMIQRGNDKIRLNFYLLCDNIKVFVLQNCQQSHSRLYKGINLRNFHHCTKQRKLQLLGQKGAVKGCGNWFCQVLRDCMNHNHNHKLICSWFVSS